MTDWQFLKRRRAKRLSKVESIRQHHIDYQERANEDKPVEPGSFDAKAMVERLYRK